MPITNDFKVLVTFKHWTCIAQVHHYSNNQKAICLVDAEDGEPIATASVNISEWTQMENEIYIKEYSENTGMTSALINAGIIYPDARTIGYGPYQAPVSIATLKHPELWKKK